MKKTGLYEVLYFLVFLFGSMFGVLGQEVQESDTTLANAMYRKGVQFIESKEKADKDSAHFYLRASEKIYGPYISEEAPDYIWEGYLRALAMRLNEERKYSPNPSSVIPELSETLVLCDKHLGKDNLTTYICSNFLGLAYYRSRDIAHAIPCFRRFEIGNVSEDNFTLFLNEQMIGLYYLGTCYRMMGMSDSAAYYYQMVLDKEKENAVDIRSYHSTFWLAMVREQEGRLEEAQALSLKGLKLSADDSRKKAMSYNQLGMLHKRQGDYKRSLAYMQKSFEEKMKSYGPDHYQIAIQRVNLGVLFSNMGDLVKAIEHYQKALDDTKGQWFPEKSLIYTNLAIAYRHDGEFQKGIGILREGIQLTKEKLGPDDFMMGQLYMSLGDIYREIKVPDSAYFYCSKSKKIFEETPNPDFLSSFFILEAAAEAAFEVGKHNEAFQILEQLEAFTNFRAPTVMIHRVNIHETRGDMYAKLNQPDLAVEEYTKVLSFIQKMPGSELPENLSFKVDFLSKFASFISTPSASVQTLQYADSLYEEAITLSTQLRNSYSSSESQLSHQDRYADLYPKAAAVSISLSTKASDPPRLKKAFERVEKGKASLLADAIKQSGAIAFSGMPAELIEKERQLKIDLAYYEKAVFDESQEEDGGNAEKIKSWKDKRFSLNEEYDLLQELIKKNYPAYVQFKSSDAVAGIGQIQEILPVGTGFMEYALADSQVLAFLITPDDFVVKSLGMISPQDTDSLRWGLHGYYTGSVPGKSQNWYDVLFRKKAYAMYQTLVEPFAATLPQKLIIVTDGHLGYIPFEAFLTQQVVGNKSHKEYPFLLKEKQVSYAYSASVYHFSQTQSQNRKSLEPLLAVAPKFKNEIGPQLAASNLRRDPFAELIHNSEEAVFISTLLGGVARVGDQARKSDFLKEARNHKVIHIASHAVVNDQHPNYSFIAFTPSEDSLEDPLLYLSEIYNLELDADLVVLSACNSGIGTLYRGEGIASLARGFTYAGSKSLVTTLWSVNDNYIAELMKGFYRNLKEGKPKDEALRVAKLALLEENNLPPFYWAAPIAIGDMSPISSSEIPSWVKYGGILLLLIMLFVFSKNWK